MEQAHFLPDVEGIPLQKILKLTIVNIFLKNTLLTLLLLTKLRQKK